MGDIKLETDLRGRCNKDNKLTNSDKVQGIWEIERFNHGWLGDEEMREWIEF